MDTVLCRIYFAQATVYIGRRNGKVITGFGNFLDFKLCDTNRVLLKKNVLSTKPILKTYDWTNGFLQYFEHFGQPQQNPLVLNWFRLANIIHILIVNTLQNEIKCII